MNKPKKKLDPVTGLVVDDNALDTTSKKKFNSNDYIGKGFASTDREEEPEVEFGATIPSLRNISTVDGINFTRKPTVSSQLATFSDNPLSIEEQEMEDQDEIAFQESLSPEENERLGNLAERAEYLKDTKEGRDLKKQYDEEKTKLRLKYEGVE